MYKNLYLAIVFFVFLFSGSKCELDDYLVEYDNGINYLNNNGFSIAFDNNEVYNRYSIDFYDVSSHMIYLKDGRHFDCDEWDEFSVNVGGEEIYSGHIEHAYSSFLWDGPVVRSPNLYSDNIIPIELSDASVSVDQLLTMTDDQRGNKKVIDALKNDGLYREGLSARITDIRKTFNNSISLEIKITNNDSEDLYYLDPDRLGNREYHYFTNGLTLTDPRLNNYGNNIQYEDPGQNQMWREEWLSLLKQGESKTITIVYPDFDELPVGSYYATFTLPGGGFPENRGDIWYNNGRIWLGDLQVARIVQID